MISASLVLYNNRIQDVEKVLECVISSNISCLQIVDHSTVDTYKDLAKISNKIHYIHTYNDGYGKGHNVGFAESQKYGFTKYHIVINPDIYFNPDAIDCLVNYMETHSDVGLVMPKVYYPNGEFQYLCKMLPKPSDIFLRQFAPKLIREINDNNYAMKTADFDKVMDVPSLSGCFMFFRSEIFMKIGGFDQRFFMHFEDIDITRRVGDIARTVYCPYSKIIHAHEAAHKKSLKMLFIGLKSALLYFNKWGWFYDKIRTERNKKAYSYIQ